jgi:hypothetical protein
MRAQTLDLFQPKQGDLFAGEEPRNAGHASANPDLVRARLQDMLAQAQAATSPPWDERTTRLYCTVFPQMAKWLPEAEGQKLLHDFQQEMTRLKAP